VYHRAISLENRFFYKLIKQMYPVAQARQLWDLIKSMYFLIYAEINGPGR